jgi:hypothetical protein
MSTEHVLAEGSCGAVRWRLTLDLHDVSIPLSIAAWSGNVSYFFEFSFLCFQFSGVVR